MATDTQDLSISVEQPSSWSRRLSVTVPAERVKTIRRKVAQQIAGNVRLPGFRKGKLPQSLIDKQFGPAIEQETLDRVIQETYREALDREQLQPISQGEVQNVHYHGEGGELHYDVELEVQPTVELARTSGFVVPRPSDEVGESEVDGILERLRTERAVLKPAEGRKPRETDEVEVEITALDDEEGAAEPQPYRFVLGENQAIPDIEQAILSLDPGTDGEFEVAFPDDFPDEEQRGRTRKMNIRLLAVRERELPELDDDFATGFGEFDSMAALRERVLADLRDDARRGAEAALRDGLIGQVLEANPIEVPNSMVERYLDFMTGQGEQRGGKKRTLPAEQQERISQLRQVMRPQAEASLKRMMVVEALADREQLRATQDEVDARVESLAEQHGRSPGDVWLELEKSGQLQALESEITEEKVFDWLRRQNTIA